MKKILIVILSFSVVVILSSFVIVHNVIDDKTETTLSNTDDGWEYYKTVSVLMKEGGYDYTLYIWKKQVCGDPDYILSKSKTTIDCECAISKNYSYGMGQDWTSEYKYVTTLRSCISNPSGKGYFNAYLQGWD